MLRLDDVVDQRVNIVGFSVFNETHPFYQDFALSLNRSWQENCDHAPFAGTPVGGHATEAPHGGRLAGTGSGLTLNLKTGAFRVLLFGDELIKC